MSDDPGDSENPVEPSSTVEFRANNFDFTLTPLWEMNLAEDFQADAEDNDHNFFMLNDKLYAISWNYIKGETNPINLTLHSFDISTGTHGRKPLTLPEPFAGDGTNVYAGVTSDGKIAIIQLRGFKPQASGDMHIITVGIFDMSANDELVNGRIKQFECAKTGGEWSDHFIRSVAEFYSVDKGSGEEYLFRFGCWYGEKDSGSFFPTLLAITVDLTDGVQTAPVFDTIVFTPDNHNLFERTGNIEEAFDLLMAEPLEDGNYMVQRYGHSKGDIGADYSELKKICHSPLMIFEPENAQGSSMRAAGSTTYKLKEVMTADGFTQPKEHCFGAMPFKVCSTKFMVVPTEFSTGTGPQFALATWDGQNLSSFAPVANGTMPRKTTFPYPNPKGGIYGMERPKFLQREVDFNNTDIYAYMPGSGIGAYRLTNINGDLSASETVVTETTAPTVTLRGRSLTIASTDNAPTCELYSISGQLVSTITLSPSGATTVDLDLPAGAYILRVATTATKILLH